MRTRYCLRREIGACLKKNRGTSPGRLRMENKNHIFDLEFDCENCEMSVVYAGKKENS